MVCLSGLGCSCGDRNWLDASTDVLVLLVGVVGLLWVGWLVVV